jgi:galactokinase/mevalonate kinase-like predicted kinase
LTSLDRGRRWRLDRVEQLHDLRSGPAWSRLPRACLALFGLAGGRTAGPLREALAAFGGGIDLTLASAVPSGSGLGVSSILAAAVLACLGRLAGRKPDFAGLVRQVLLLEQRLGSGGGWQDQVGGLAPGAKLARTRPGADQVPSLEPLPFPAEWTRSRLVLCYTGPRQPGRRILHTVVRSYLAREPGTLRVIEELREGAADLAGALARRDYGGFAAGLQRTWELKKRLAPGSTAPAVEALLLRIDPFCSGYSLMGAGGGGFLLLAARDESAAASLRAELADRPGDHLARLFDFAVDDRGLTADVF